MQIASKITEDTMTELTIIRTSRSANMTYQRCPRSRYHAYHACGTGLAPTAKPLPLVVGGCVHDGLAYLLTHGQHALDEGGLALRIVEDDAVRIALDSYAPHRHHIALPDAEARDMEAAAHPPAIPAADLADFGAILDLPQEEGAGRGYGTATATLRDRWLAYVDEEQAALIEGMVRAYARERLLPLLAEFVVLEVEREGEWLVGAYPDMPGNRSLYAQPWELRWQSRPDALLLERATGQLQIMSFKTAASWDQRKEQDARHDSQGLSEGVEIEQRLARWWKQLHDNQIDKEMIDENYSDAMAQYLVAVTAPPTIYAIRYEFLYKGERRIDKSLSAEYGFPCRVQCSPLVRPYRNSDTGEHNCSWDYIKADGSTSKLNYRAWSSQPVWREMSPAAWMDHLADAREMADGWHTPAQSTGSLPCRPLAELFATPLTIFRDPDDLLNWAEQMAYQEEEIAGHVAEVNAAKDEGERRSLLNRYFPMTRSACSYPSQCFATGLCFGGGDEVRGDPIGSGLFVARKSNHPGDGGEE
jgi:hypothetical protein